MCRKHVRKAAGYQSSLQIFAQQSKGSNASSIQLHSILYDQRRCGSTDTEIAVAGPAGMPAQVMLDSWGVDKAERQKYLCMPNDPRLEHC
jgi:hypothetical protein